MQLLAIIFGLAAQAVFNSAAPLQRTLVDYYDPAKLGGSMLDKATPTAGEPLNVSVFLDSTHFPSTGLIPERRKVIISGKSSPQVLTKGGIVNYARAIGL